MIKLFFFYFKLIDKILISYHACIWRYVSELMLPKVFLLEPLRQLLLHTQGYLRTKLVLGSVEVPSFLLLTLTTRVNFIIMRRKFLDQINILDWTWWKKYQKRLTLTSLSFNVKIFLLCLTTAVGFLPCSCLAEEPTNTSPSFMPTHAGVVRSPASFATTSRRPSWSKDKNYCLKMDNTVCNSEISPGIYHKRMHELTLCTAKQADVRPTWRPKYTDIVNFFNNISYFKFSIFNESDWWMRIGFPENLKEMHREFIILWWFYFRRFSLLKNQSLIFEIFLTL